MLELLARNSDTGGCHGCLIIIVYIRVPSSSHCSVFSKDNIVRYWMQNGWQLWLWKKFSLQHVSMFTHKHRQVRKTPNGRVWWWHAVLCFDPVIIICWWILKPANWVMSEWHFRNYFRYHNTEKEFFFFHQQTEQTFLCISFSVFRCITC